MSSFEQIRYTRQDNIGELTLHRPEKRNAQTPQMWSELGELGRTILADPGDLLVLVVRGAGGCFSSGLDTSLFTSGELASVDGRAVQAAFRWLREGPFVSLAVMEKFAIGAGLELALWCDLRLATTGCFFALPEIEHGILPDLGGCALLPEICGYSRAMELITTARRIDASEAKTWGLVNQVVDPEQLETSLHQIIKLLASRSPMALHGAKRSTLSALSSIDHSLEVSQQAVTNCLQELRK
jgi:enoyl-CoA hydratase/carnithine racemase